jgi:potassium-transporting ATPase KdpC subunit
MRQVLSKLKPALLLFGLITILCGIVYPLLVTGLAQWWFPGRANGSVIRVTLKDGTTAVYGSELIAQQFTKPEYLIGRPLGTTNLSPTGDAQKALVEQRVQWWKALDPENTADIPMDLVTASGSGVDPNISPEAAEYQAERIARVRALSPDAIREVIARYTTGRFLGLFGEPVVNVLKVNLALDGLI